MTTLQTHGAPEQGKLEHHLAELLGFGSTGEALGGAAAIVLAILGLAGVLPAITLPLAGLAIGAGLLFVGGAVAARFTRLVQSIGGELTGVEMGPGATAEFLGGAAGIVLSILSLLRLMPMELMPIAAIIYGGAILIGSGVTARLNDLELISQEAHPTARQIARESTRAATAIQVLVGLGAAVLGILSLVGVGIPLMLTLVALLSVGGSILLSSGTFAGRVIGMFSH